MLVPCVCVEESCGILHLTTSCTQTQHFLRNLPQHDETKPVEPTAGTPANVYDHSAPAPAATAETKADGDVEAQKAAPAAAASAYDDEAGKSIGFALFICIVVGFALGWIGGEIS
eukprot:scaffold36221_cov144-Skeletonema_dohrnii-CCMP3373.AAC.2